MRKDLTPIQKAIVKEVYSCIDQRYLADRIDYITMALLYHARYGMLKFQRQYPTLNMKTSDLYFYLEELRKRLDYLQRLQKLDEEKYRKLGLID